MNKSIICGRLTAKDNPASSQLFIKKKSQAIKPIKNIFRDSFFYI
ncbi:hypothetical protein AB28_4157 [Raoultella ornithinolytica 2-156-04_S1_C2]|nr:hypothetical protein AB00_4160 [Raoultella ornithinolytica 2-156-04_S1_C1]KDX11548.1 hypothetical protein AB28_4157 [Raoultella ornithinolytica 2-156-04_S1_C2]